MSSEGKSDLLGPRRLTRYELVRIISIRAQQIAAGSPLFLDEDEIPKGVDDPVELAKLELKKGRLPILIERKRGDETVLIPLSELIQD